MGDFMITHQHSVSSQKAVPGAVRRRGKRSLHLEYVSVQINTNFYPPGCQRPHVINLPPSVVSAISKIGRGGKGVILILGLQATGPLKISLYHLPLIS